MVAEKRLKELAAEKRLLRLQCELHRKLIVAECGRLVSFQNCGNQGAEWWTRMLPASLLLAPLAGMAVAGRWRTIIRGLEWGLTLWRLIRSLVGILKATSTQVKRSA